MNLMGVTVVFLYLAAAVTTSSKNDEACKQHGMDEDPVCLLQLRGGDKISTNHLGSSSSFSRRWIPKLRKQEMPSGTALCLDGSTPFYFLHTSTSGSNNWVIGLQGGGICTGEADCTERSKTPKGSSNTWNDVSLAHHLSLTVPMFADFNHVHVRYCSGDTWMGTHVADDRSWGLHFNGHNIFADVVADLLANRGMDSADVVVLTGSSAGALGAYHNAGFLYDKLHEDGRSIPMMLAPEGMFQTAKFHSVVVPRVSETDWGSCALGHGSGHLPEMDSIIESKCVAAVGEANKNTCLDAMVYLPYLLEVMPVMVIYNRYDVHPMEMELLMKLREPSRTEGMKAWSVAVDVEFDALLNRANSDRLGFFVSSCFKHANAADGASIDGRDLGAVVGQWFSYQADKMNVASTPGTAGIEPADFHARDHYDQVAHVQCNPTCLSVDNQGRKKCKGDEKSLEYVADTSLYCAEPAEAQRDPCEDAEALREESTALQSKCGEDRVASCNAECVSAYRSSVLAGCTADDVAEIIPMPVQQVEALMDTLNQCPDGESL